MYDMNGATDANRALLLEHASQAILDSSCFRSLHIESLRSYAEVAKLFKTLADSDIDSLWHLTISNECQWFRGDQDESMTPLLTLLARQTGLKTLTMDCNVLKAQQLQAIRALVS